MTTKNRRAGEAYNLCQYLLKRGTGAMSDTDLLGIVLGSPTLARSLHKRSNEWQNLSRVELAKLTHFGPKRIAQVLALVELSGRIISKPLTSDKSICCSADVAGIYRPRLTSQKQECFYVLALDIKNRVISEYEVAKGTLTHVEVHPREVFRPLIMAGAARAIVIHNHPSGNPKPSSQDASVCRRLVEVSRLLEIQLLDFIIVGAEGSSSFRDMGMMSNEI